MIGSSVSSWLNVLSAFRERTTNACVENGDLAHLKYLSSYFKEKMQVNTFLNISLSAGYFGVNASAVLGKQ